MREQSDKRMVIWQDVSPDASTTPDAVTVILSDIDHVRVSLSFSPFDHTSSILTALAFQRVLRQILEIGSPESLTGDHEIVWSANEDTSAPAGVVFASDAMLAVLRIVKKIAPTEVGILVTGETGAGKEVIARAIHDHSRRSSMPFRALNCAAVPKELLESQLFGHRKRAFPGATENHQGIVRAANGGTLLLDEIGGSRWTCRRNCFAFSK